jgi:serine phosphatase RsbU (regulator of sigma subunit)
MHVADHASDREPERRETEGDARFRELFEAIDEGYCLCEMIVADDGTPLDYRFLETNPLFEEMTGLQGAVGKTAYELVPDLEPHWVETYARAALGNERVRFELGSEAMGRWFDVFTMPVGPPRQFAIVFKDETRRHEALIALRENEQRFRVLAEQQRQISQRLQRALLPDALVEHPEVEITAHYSAGSSELEVGGDWYDTYMWPSGEVGAMVGDVVGHGVEAAAEMGRLRAAVAALIPLTNGSPAAMIDALAACSEGPNGSDYLTACCVVLNPTSRVLRYSLAGHPPVLLIAPDGSTQWLDEARSLPLGGLLGNGRHGASDRTEASVVVDPGSHVVLFSDGLVERRSESISDGLERLERTATRLIQGDYADLSQSIADEMRAQSTPVDDVVVLCLSLARRG